MRRSQVIEGGDAGLGQLDRHLPGGEARRSGRSPRRPGRGMRPGPFGGVDAAAADGDRLAEEEYAGQNAQVDANPASGTGAELSMMSTTVPGRRRSGPRQCSRRHPVPSRVAGHRWTSPQERRATQSRWDEVYRHVHGAGQTRHGYPQPEPSAQRSLPIRGALLRTPTAPVAVSGATRAMSDTPLALRVTARCARSSLIPV